MNAILQDVRYAIRMLVKSPGFTAIAILTIALGIGANSAIFSVVNAVLLRPLPYENSDRLVFLSENSEQIPDMSISMENFRDWQKMNRVFESMMPYRAEDVVLTGNSAPERLRSRQVTADLFAMLRIKPLRGRALGAEDDKPGAERVVLLSDGYWKRKFGGDDGLLGKRITLSGELYTIIGVIASSSFHGSWKQYDVFTSLWREEPVLGGPANRGNHPGIYAYARLKPGVTVAQAQSEMKTIAARLAEQYPKSNAGSSVRVDSLLNAVVEDVRPPLLLLLGAVGFVLLIACANVANLLLARAAERQTEIAIRRTLGAGHWRLVRQLLTESVLLSLLGGTLGTLLAVWLTAAIAHFPIPNVPRLEDVRLDRTVLLFTAGISVATGLLFGLFPALQVSSTDMTLTLKEGGRGGSGGKRRAALRSALVVAEVAISFVLLAGAGLMVRSLSKVIGADSGFTTARVMAARFTLPDQIYPQEAKRRNFTAQLVEKLKAIPGVESAGVRNPLLGSWQTSLIIQGRPIPPPDKVPSTDIARVTPDALATMGVRLLRGRYFTESDSEVSLPVCIIDKKLADEYWPGEDALGKQLSVEGRHHPGQEPKWRTVVGIVAHVKNYGVDQPSRAETYVPNAQDPAWGGTIVVRAAGRPETLTAAIREAVQSVDADLPLYGVQTLEQVADENVAPRRLSVYLMTAFAGIALLLAGVGLYGVMSHSVAQRNHEFGVRMALGATGDSILRMVLKNGLLLLATGLALGIAGAVALSRFLQTLLFQVPAIDLATYGTIAVLLGIAAMQACYLPAQRATRTDPLAALRYE